MERDYKTETAKELEIKPGSDKLQDYTSNWIRRANREPRNRLHHVVDIYAPKTERTSYEHRRDLWV